MPLILAAVGETYRIHSVGGNQDVRNHLENLGFTCDSEVRVVSKIFGNLIVNIKNSRIALSEDLAKKIMV